MKKIMTAGLFILWLHPQPFAQNVLWGDANSRTEFRENAGLQGDAGAVSGFFQTSAPVNYPAGAGGWWHLLDVRHSNPTNNFAMQFAGNFFDQQLWFRKTNNNPAQSWSKVLLETNGRVGIGTSAPAEALEVAGNIRANNLLLAAGTTISSSGRMHITGDEILFLLNRSGVTIGKEWGGTGDLRVQGITTIGNVPATPAGYSLYVASGILAEKVKVAIKTTANWSDHVFEPGYRLQPLHELEAFIKTNKHLPGIPAAQTMVKEGLDLAEMNAKLLAKVEELTLHVIELKKTYDRQLTVLHKRLSAKRYRH